ncbi:hypothetical protein [Absidia glauca]|uniref:Formin GTPase-binding domain-containing protein n=1 Tax=Absidia glauca TaxID=4829 RepID=A0A163KHA0_ABSGL|nr:hypothetical protein [Absidia glauca]
MIQYSGRNMPTRETSTSPNQLQQQQPRLFNRMSGFLFQRRQGTIDHDEYEGGSSSTATAPSVTPTTLADDGHSPLHNSALDEDTSSCVDSMFSTLPTNYNTNTNPNTAPPLRTVQLDGGIVHHPGSGAPPTPPRRISTQPARPLSTSDTNSPTTAAAETTTAATASASATTTVSPTNSTSNAEDFHLAFEKMAHEYGLPNDVAKTLSLEAKQVLLRNSQANSFQQINNNNNNGFFSWRTWGIQKKQKQHMDVRQDRFFDPSTSATPISPTSSTNSETSSSQQEDSINHGRTKAYSTSARNRSQRAPISTFTQAAHNSITGTRRKKQSARRHDRTTKKGPSSPAYFIHLLKDCHVRNLDESQVQDLRVCLRSVKASWTTQFLDLGGYTILSDLFRQMHQAPKRSPNDDKILQHLAKCFKAIMTHEQAGIAIVLTNPVGLGYIRDLLFGSLDQKQRSLYSLSVTTRAHFLNILCTLANLQTTQSATTPYIHGYDVLRRLLLDCPTTTSAVVTSTSTDSMDNEPPFRMTLKQDPQHLMRLIVEDDPFYTDDQPLKPRYTAWMRELQYTVEKEIEPITFLAQVLDYKFESAFRQLRIKSSQQEQVASDPPPSDLNQEAASTLEEGTGSVMVDDGVVEYLVAHLRLINTVVATQPTFQKVPYDDRGREKVRMEIMMSGFDKIAKALQYCPHPTLYALYFRYLQPLLQPLATLYADPPSRLSTTEALPTRDGMLQWEDDVRQASSSGILFEQPPWADDSFYEDDDDSDGYEDYDSEDEEGMETFRYHDDDDDDDAITSERSHEHRWKMGAAVAR